MLGRQLERLNRCKSLERLIIATSIDPTDDELALWLLNQKFLVHRGPLDDVLTRFIQVAEAYHATWVVRLTGDCPLADPEIIDLTVRAAVASDKDYYSNIEPPTWPHGLDVEVMKMDALRVAAREARYASQREHVTPFIRKQPHRFSQGVLTSPVDLSHIRLTVDEVKDFELVSRIFEALLPINPTFALADILDLLKKNPEWLQINAHLKRPAVHLKLPYE